MVLLGVTNVLAQTLRTRNGVVKLEASSPLEKIEAVNQQTLAVLNTSEKTIQATLLIKGFLFEKALMQEHFNENYLESDKFPKAAFSGQFDPALTAAATPQTVTLKGKMTIHGVTRDITVPVTITPAGNGYSGQAKMEIIPGDYNIQVPALVRDKIAPTVKIICQFEWKQP